MQWVIRKSGYFYRPNRSGYTTDIIAAGIFTEKEAKAEASIEPDSMSAHPVSEYRDQIKEAKYLISRFNV